MRILRSQYLKYKAQDGPQDSFSNRTATTVSSSYNGTQIQHTASKEKRDGKSRQTVTKTTRTTVHSSSFIPFNNNANTIICRRNSSIPYTNTQALTAQALQSNLSTSKDNESRYCVDKPPEPLAIQKRRQTVASVGDDLIKEQIVNALKIKLLNTPIERYTRINVVVRFYDEGTMWYTRFYRSYQDVLWLKIPRGGDTRKTKWYFKCVVCQKKLCSFATLKSHLNIHMGFFPFRCEICPKQYPAKYAYTRHMKTKHPVEL
ncbi:uncharacterized protein LOC105665496 [Ceratitis capitata]|uniref:uncharacterized protein LOC105665496 n=1 Tax=Ceratitis capitata TaxID=7213 RepID=UPI0006188921|nr:uncharacterized protein LOC105665496 [Ceratitis capitata]